MNSLTCNHRGATITKLPSGKWFRYWTKPNGKRVRQYFFGIRCGQCGKPSFTSTTRDRRTKHHFCTHDCKNLFQKGENHPGWKGGVLTKAGHRYVRKDDHPRASNGYIAEHALVAESKLGRLLIKGEMVHHIDGDKLNNNPENLSVMTNSQHGAVHQSLNGILKGLMENGIVWFDKKQHIYKSKYGQREIHNRSENVRQRLWRKGWFKKHGRAYRPPSRGAVCSVATSHSKPIGQVCAGGKNGKANQGAG